MDSLETGRGLLKLWPSLAVFFAMSCAGLGSLWFLSRPGLAAPEAKAPAARSGAPALDRDLPAHLETATFALG